MRNGKIVDKHGNQFWYANGELHREDGPAIIGRDGTQSWWINGKRHREDGPAIIWSDGVQEWWINGEQLTKSQWWDMLSHDQKLRSLFSGEGV